MNRLEVLEQVLTCEGCPLWSCGAGPLPFSGPTPAHVAVIGGAPQPPEVEAFFRAAMASAGMDASTVFFANTISCAPAAGGRPTGEHINACCHNLKSQLELADPRWVLLLGGVALAGLRPDLKVTRARRHAFYPPGRPRFLSTVDPVFAMNNPKGDLMLRSDLALFVQMIEAPDETWRGLASFDCVLCGTEVDELAEHDGHVRFDEMGAIYCDACWDRLHRAPTPPPEAKPEAMLLFGDT